MGFFYRIIFVLVVCFVFGVSAGGGVGDPSFSCRGMSDASAGVGLGDGLFIVADDENNVLRVYDSNQPCEPVSTYDLGGFLDVDPGSPEADIEGATAAGDLIYWISSHGRNKDGKMRESRYRFFATSVKTKNGKVTVSPVGVPCRTLVHEMVKSKMTRGLGLGKVTQFDAKKLKKKEREKLAPKKNGLNIESLCATPDGKRLYIGFRNPQFLERGNSKGKAIVVPLDNPRQVVEKGSLPVFGAPVLWDMGGLGVRSMEYSHFHKSYFVIAGPSGGSGEFALYRWGGKKEQPVLVRKFAEGQRDFTPEALIIFEKTGEMLVLSDDGSIAVEISAALDCVEGEMLRDGKCPNKYLSDQNKKSFRGMRLNAVP